MKYTPIEPPRRFEVGLTQAIELRDCARIELAADEQVTFLSASGAEYDVVRKTWGYYATPSLNGRLKRFGLRGALIRNRHDRHFVVLVERSRRCEFDRYLRDEGLEVVRWLDDAEELGRLATPACLCGRSNCETVHIYQAPPDGETRFAPDAESAYRRELRRCIECGHFTSVGSAVPDALYNALYVDATYGSAGLRRAYDRIMGLPPERSDNTARVERVDTFARRRGPDGVRKLLDVGSGLGVFAAAMKARGWRVTGLDPDPRACGHARDVVGVEAVCSEFMTASGLDRFDVVSLNKVLEHVDDPIAMLKHTHSCLAPDGFVYLEVPDGPAAFADGPHREEFFIEHIHAFSRRSVEIMARRAGFAVAALEFIREPSTKYTILAMLLPERGSMRWSRTTPLGASGTGVRHEVWECRVGDDAVASWEVAVTVGKALDVVQLKGADLDDIRAYAAFLRETAGRLYAADAPRQPVLCCPCCAATTTDAREAMVVLGATYRRCRACQHVFVADPPAPEALRALLAASDDHAVAYTDAESIESRLQQVVAPKLDWVRGQFRTRFGRELERLIDVGAGGGHFVEMCHRQGLDAEGYEISSASRRFARAAFNVELRDADFTTENGAPSVDVVTFWGLLEYMPEPRKLLEAARRRLIEPVGMLVVEVPRFDCLGTAVQSACPDTIARHMDPTSHVNCFCESSLAAALRATGFRIVAAWHFGMDAYELLVQLAMRNDDREVLRRWAHLIPVLQAGLDAAMHCDDLVVAAVPEPGWSAP